MKPTPKAARGARHQPAPAPAAPSLPWWLVPAALLGALLVYLPALRGPFVFDDLTLPVLQPGFSAPLASFFHGVRPLYYLSLYAQHQLFGDNPLPFHLVNWLLHAANSLLLLGILRRYCRLGGLPLREELAASAFGAGIFLLHPLNTEAVSYIASHSECLSVCFAFLAWRLFLDHREPRLSLPAALATLALLALALGVKEHVLALAAVFLLTDLIFGGWRANLRFYAPLALLGVAGAALILSRINNATAGFGVAGVTPLGYLVTQGEVLWRYLQLAVLPLGQSVDHGVAVSIRPLGFAGLAALALVTVLLWRKAPRLALFGWLAFLLLLAPTSSFIPIADAMAERRVYLAMPGLALLAAPWLRRLPLAALAGILLLFSLAALQRNQQWASAELLWRDAVAGNPANSRAHFQLAHALYLGGNCAQSLPHYAAAERHGGAEDALYIDWALAADCASQSDEALRLLARASETNHLRWATAGMVDGKRGRHATALASLDRALALNPNFAMTWVYRGNVLLGLNQPQDAETSFRKALALEPANPAARQGLNALPAR